MEKLFQKYDFQLDNVTKIFGLFNIEKSEIKNLLNSVLHIGLKCIWNTRIELEHRNKNFDVWKKFKTEVIKNKKNPFGIRKGKRNVFDTFRSDRNYMIELKLNFITLIVSDLFI